MREANSDTQNKNKTQRNVFNSVQKKITILQTRILAAVDMVFIHMLRVTFPLV